MADDRTTGGRPSGTGGVPQVELGVADTPGRAPAADTADLRAAGAAAGTLDLLAARAAGAAAGAADLRAARAAAGAADLRAARAAAGAADLRAAGAAAGTADLRAAGAAVLRPTAAGAEILLVHRQRYGGDWSLPKGKLRPDEAWPVAAVRETLEETGYTVRLGAPVGSTRYTVRGRPKEVRFWVAAAVGEQGRRIGDEVDGCAWFAVDRALELLSYDGERAVAAAAAAAESTVPLVIARHAKARSRKQWPGADADRPLAKRGNDQAVRLTGLLSAWSPLRVVTSPSLRCVDSITPYAAVTGASLEIEPLLSEEGHRDDPAAVEQLVRAALRAARDQSAQSIRSDHALAAGGAVLCTHRPVLPAIADALRITLSAEQQEEALPTAGCWILHVRADGSTQLEQHAV